MNQLTIRRWNNRWFVRQSDMQVAFLIGIVDREIVKENQYRAWYKFSTKDGIEIATVSKDHTCGFCSQAYGPEVSDRLLGNLWIRAEY